MHTKLAPVVVALFLAASLPHIKAADAEPVPVQVAALHDKLTGQLSPAMRTWVLLEGDSISKDPYATATTAQADVQSHLAGQSHSPGDIDAITFLVLVESEQNVESDLSSMMKKEHGAKSSSRLQAAMKRCSDFIEALAALQKKIPASQSAGFPNLK